MVMVKFTHKVGGVITREVVVELEVMVIQGSVECNLLARLPILMNNLTIIPFKKRPTLRCLI